MNPLPLLQCLVLLLAAASAETLSPRLLRSPKAGQLALQNNDAAVAHRLTPVLTERLAYRSFQFTPRELFPGLELFASSSWEPRSLKRRQAGTCDSNEQVCGDGCIPITSTCCPDGSGGCALGKYCTLGDNNQYGCCNVGSVCTGNGGTVTTCDTDEKVCGSGCIPTTSTCCPDASGGCAAGTYCALDNNGKYGCCANGQTCSGSAGGGGGGTCGSGEVVCGNGCIPTTATCCPDRSGGCPSGRYCAVGSDGQYGCCPNGQTCTGTGGGGGGGGSTCGSSETVCGVGCIPTSATCCPDKSGGCPSGSYCTTGSNGQYGCCTSGRTCTGAVSGSSTTAPTSRTTRLVPVTTTSPGSEDGGIDISTPGFSMSRATSATTTRGTSSTTTSSSFAAASSTGFSKASSIHYMQWKWSTAPAIYVLLVMLGALTLGAGVVL